MSELTDNPALMDLGEALAALDRVNPLRLAGRVSEVTGLVIRANVPGIRVGELVWIDSTPPCAPTPMLPGAAGTTAGRVQAEVVGFRGDDVVLLPLGEAAGIGPDSMVTPTGRPLAITAGPGLLGRGHRGRGAADRRGCRAGRQRRGKRLPGGSRGAPAADPPAHRPPA